MTMHPALKALTTGFLDYAGLFPPAALALETALQQFAAYMDHPQASFLGRFVLPASSCAQAKSWLQQYFAKPTENATKPWHFSIICQGASDSSLFLNELDKQLLPLEQFLTTFGEKCVVDAVEIALPKDVLGDSGQVARFVASAVRRFPESWQTFFEVPLDRTPLLALEGLSFVPRAKAKFRTGSTNPDLIPSSQSLALALSLAAQYKVGCKFTAGLHQPVRNYDDHLSTYVFGFLNVFLASFFASIHAYPHDEICRILDCQDPSAFQLKENGIAFQDHVLSVDEISYGREVIALSFGSCSFVEPVEGLQQLGFL
jgi:hypothetical protein